MTSQPVIYSNELGKVLLQQVTCFMMPSDIRAASKTEGEGILLALDSVAVDVLRRHPNASICVVNTTQCFVSLRSERNQERAAIYQVLVTYLKS